MFFLVFFLYWCYYSYTSRYLVYPVCGILFFFSLFHMTNKNNLRLNFPPNLSNLKQFFSLNGVTFLLLVLYDLLSLSQSNRLSSIHWLKNQFLWCVAASIGPQQSIYRLFSIYITLYWLLNTRYCNGSVHLTNKTLHGRQRIWLSCSHCFIVVVW